MLMSTLPFPAIFNRTDDPLSTMADEILVQKIQYWKQVKDPTLPQFLMRKAMREASSKARGVKGTVIDKETGKLMPRSAYKVKKKLEDVTPEKIAREHPAWVDEYCRLYNKKSGKDLR